MMKLVFQKQDLISYFILGKYRMRFGMKYHTLLAIEPFQLWLQIYIFNCDKNDGRIFHDECFMIYVTDEGPWHIETAPLIWRAKMFRFTFQVLRFKNLKLRKTRPSHKMLSLHPPRFQRSNKYNLNVQYSIPSLAHIPLLIVPPKTHL